MSCPLSDLIEAFRLGDMALPMRRIVVDSVVPTGGPREPVGPAQTFTFIEDPPAPYDLPHTD